ncbi:hypothetical protein HU200_035810 [Digitaria exilis]|uniref:Uncharacterized protein n=1 Tax=Digitaria exilis TaxID=1010633 RepID=A0A835BH35_9POAL|nr:hypothetical protein HU200_035810 [Digitaria exilis]CAB3466982.1 unnamed protein product [Digitaria exilis]
MDQRLAVVGDAATTGLVQIGVVVLTVTSATAIYRAAIARDVASAAFVAASYGALLTLLRSLRAYELAPAAERGRFRLRVWALCTLLTGLFACKVAGVVPLLVAVGVWVVAAATSAGGFVLMFRHQRRRL